jgi:hypothetical protein
MEAGLLLCARCVKKNGRGEALEHAGGTNLGTAPAMTKLIVRRGMRPEYYGFMSVTAGANGDELIVDRRHAAVSLSADGAPEPEIPDRRGPASEKWIDEDVIVVQA